HRAIQRGVPVPLPQHFEPHAIRRSDSSNGQPFELGSVQHPGQHASSDGVWSALEVLTSSGKFSQTCRKNGEGRQAFPIFFSTLAAARRAHCLAFRQELHCPARRRG